LRISFFWVALCAFFIFGACGFQPGGFSPAGEQAETPIAAENEWENHPGLALLILSSEEKRDLILTSYRDPSFQAEVVAFFQGICGSEDIADVILSNASVLDVSASLAFSLCAEESAYKPRAVNRNRNETIDRGLFQLNSATFPKLTTDDFFDPGLNAWYGLSHLRWCLDTAGTDVAGLAIYNAGASRVGSAGTPKKTLDYVSRILKRQQKIEELFIAEYIRILQSRNSEIEFVQKKEKAPFRLSLLTPLGSRR
jgi:hypothetical protein